MFFFSEVCPLTYLYAKMILTFQRQKEGEPIPFRVIMVGRYMTCPNPYKFPKKSSLLALQWRIEWKYCDLDTGDCNADCFNTWGSQKCRWYRLGLGMSRTSTGNNVRNVSFDLLEGPQACLIQVSRLALVTILCTRLQLLKRWGLIIAWQVPLWRPAAVVRCQ